MVGAAKVEVTPKGPVVLAGYGGRTKEFEGIDTKLWARAMVIGEKEPVAVVVLDNCGVPAPVTARLAKRLAKQGIAPGRLVVAATHTHNAPSLVGYAKIVWAGRTTAEQEKRMAAYTEFAIEQMAAAVMAALKGREPLHLEWAQGRANFGGNRRIIRDGVWAGFGFQRDAPVDHSLPVLAARDDKGRVRAVWANYACHCTTVGSRNHVGGDWAGFANEAMETEFPEATAMMSIGCGADIGPQPSGNLQIADQHGRSIGVEVGRLLAGETKKISSAPAVANKEVVLPLDAPTSRQHWEGEAKRGGFHGQLGKSMLAKIDSEGAIPTTVNYPVSAWKFGTDLAMVFLPGEVVVDYSVRLNRELDWSRLWITAWANAMPGYIPSRRVLREGGYEPDFSQVYYDHPGRYKPEVEDLVVGAAREVVGERFTAKADQEEAPFHRIPGKAAEAFERVAEWAESREGDELFKKVVRLAGVAQPAVERVIKKDGEETSWHNYAGDFVPRVFIRQEAKGTELGWESPVVKANGSLVLCFTGGVGWESEPDTEGFGLEIDGRQVLAFDVTRKPARWVSDDGAVELVYLPTWTSVVDSGGFYFVALAKEKVEKGKRITFSVRSLGEGSKRWFAIDAEQEMEKRLKKLREALGGK